MDLILATLSPMKMTGWMVLLVTEGVRLLPSRHADSGLIDTCCCHCADYLLFDPLWPVKVAV